MRVPFWEKNLAMVLEHHAQVDGLWGVSDCWMLAMDAVEAVTGNRVLPHLTGYRSEKAGFRLFAKHGFVTVGEALASAFEDVPPFQAMRGDLGVIVRDGVESCGVFTAQGLAVKTLYDDGTSRLEWHRVGDVRRAFRVT